VASRVGQSPRRRGTRRRRGHPAPPSFSPGHFIEHLGSQWLLRLVLCTGDFIPAWPQPIRRDPLRLGRSRRGHTPTLTASSRTVPSRDRMRQPMAAQPRAGRRGPGSIRSDFGGSGVAEVVLRGERIFFSRNPIFPLKNPNKSILTPKIVKPFPKNS
jgi:hypothetical protein